MNTKTKLIKRQMTAAQASPSSVTAYSSDELPSVTTERARAVRLTHPGAGDDATFEGGRERVHRCLPSLSPLCSAFLVGSSVRVTELRHFSAACWFDAGGRITSLASTDPHRRRAGRRPVRERSAHYACSCRRGPLDESSPARLPTKLVGPRTHRTGSFDPVEAGHRSSTSADLGGADGWQVGDRIRQSGKRADVE